MLKDSLYTIQFINTENDVVTADVELNALHKIFEGHFSNQPILPGVCMLQMTREILEVAFDKKLFLSKADDIRFVEMIDPTKNSILQFRIQYKNFNEKLLTINGKVLKADIICCKIKATMSLSLAK